MPQVVTRITAGPLDTALPCSSLQSDCAGSAARAHAAGWLLSLCRLSGTGLYYGRSNRTSVERRNRRHKLWNILEYCFYVILQFTFIKKQHGTNVSEVLKNLLIFCFKGFYKIMLIFGIICWLVYQISLLPFLLLLLFLWSFIRNSDY